MPIGVRLFLLLTVSFKLHLLFGDRAGDGVSMEVREQAEEVGSLSLPYELRTLSSSLALAPSALQQEPS